MSNKDRNKDHRRQGGRRGLSEAEREAQEVQQQGRGRPGDRPVTSTPDGGWRTDTGTELSGEAVRQASEDRGLVFSAPEPVMEADPAVAAPATTPQDVALDNDVLDMDNLPSMSATPVGQRQSVMDLQQRNAAQATAPAQAAPQATPPQGRDEPAVAAATKPLIEAVPTSLTQWVVLGIAALLLVGGMLVNFRPMTVYFAGTVACVVIVTRLWAHTKNMLLIALPLIGWGWFSWDALEPVLRDRVEVWWYNESCTATASAFAWVAPGLVLWALFWVFSPELLAIGRHVSGWPFFEKRRAAREAARQAAIRAKQQPNGPDPKTAAALEAQKAEQDKRDEEQDARAKELTRREAAVAEREAAAPAAQTSPP